MTDTNRPTPTSQIFRSWSFRLQLAILSAVMIFTAVVTRNWVLSRIVSVPLLVRLSLLLVVWRYQRLARAHLT
jgi:hypothetical protein